MKRHCVLVSGPSLSADEALIRELQEAALVLRNRDNQNLESSLRRSKIDLLIIEIAQASAVGVDLIKQVKSQFPYVIVMLVNGNGNRELIAKAFSDGIVDAFHRPYDPHLIAERALAILRQRDNP